jgi:phospho-N-acetylmuramoyl-pentapeptide-transferase
MVALSQVLAFPVPDCFLKTSSRLFFAAVTALLIVLLSGRPFIRKLVQYKIGQKIREFAGQAFHLAELHKQKKETPTMGGLLVIFSVTISILLWADLSSIYTLLLLGALLVFGTVGAIDDFAKLKSKSFKGLPGKLRLLIQSLFAGLVVLLFACPSLFTALGLQLPAIQLFDHSIEWKTFQASMYLPFVCKPIFIATGVWWLLIFFFEWLTIVGAANAVNLTDGLDGLAAGCSVFTIGALCVLSFLSNNPSLAAYYSLPYVQSSGEITVCLAALGGACLGFLWYNTYPAQVFMGDTGSLAIGGMLGTAAVSLRREWFLALIGGVFVVETFSVIIQVISFRHSGRRIFRCAPIHHHFEYAGLHEAKVVMRFWIVSLILAVVGILSLLTNGPNSQ